MSAQCPTDLQEHSVLRVTVSVGGRVRAFGILPHSMRPVATTPRVVAVAPAEAVPTAEEPDEATVEPDDAPNDEPPERKDAAVEASPPTAES